MMLSRLSLKYRIALVIFVLEGIMMTTVLWQTLGLSLDSAEEQQKLTHDMLLELVGDLSRTALLTTEYADLQLHLEQVQKEPTVERVMVVNADNRIVASAPASAIGKPFPKLENVEPRYWRRVPVATPAGPLGTLAVEFSNARLEAANARVRNLGIAIAVTGMLVIAVVGVVTGFALTRRLDRISKAAQQFAKGDLTIRASVPGQDELAVLGQTIDRMIHQVAKNQQRLKEQGEHIHLLLASTAEAIYGVDMGGICTFANSACARLLGYEHEKELIGKPIHELTQHSYVDGRPYLRKQSRIDQTFRRAEGTHGDDEVFWRKDGTSFSAEYWAYPIRRDGKVIGTVVTFIDITDRKQVEEELASHRLHLEELVDERTKELTRLNKELEAFSYSVSHDLRAPLRAIDGYSHVLLEDYGSQLDETARDYFLRVCASTQHMAELIDDILKLSRVSRSGLNKNRVDLSALAQDIMQRLQLHDTRQDMEVTIMPGLTDQADSRLLRIALENLLDNAWKYSSKTPNPRIEFGATEEDADGTVYYVRDNGAGFDMRYADKLFGTFQRLHTEHEFTGTGIGLATVQRIIHRHGGRIWAQGEEGKGATFFFTLGTTTTASTPRNDAQEPSHQAV
jgi:PAS domain S-box-containing protein